MARPKEFERVSVLEKAMHVFWAKGYECTSMNDLVDAMGINRGSLYATFGDKRKLHLETLDHFYRTQLLTVMGPLDEDGPRLAAIRRIFESAADCACDDGDRRGCMMYNTAVELCPTDQDVNEKVAAGLKRMERCFYEALTHAQANGELSADKNVTALARYLTTTLNGLRVTCMVLDDRQTLDDIVDVTLSTLKS